MRLFANSRIPKTLVIGPMILYSKFVMDLYFDISRSKGYKSASQIARVLTEDWGKRNLFCISCRRSSLQKAAENTKVYDYVCGHCREPYQLKSQSRPLSNKIIDSAYEPMIESIRINRAPNLLLLQYCPEDYCAENLVAVPRFFLSTSCIEARNPLSALARRAGWVGCYIVLKQLPPDGRIPLIENRKILNPDEARKKYSRFRFLLEGKSELRGWTADVLRVIRELGKKDFCLDDVYSFENDLKRLHPQNTHIRPKIRQQLQLLRDKGILRFRESGRYSLT